MKNFIILLIFMLTPFIIFPQTANDYNLKALDIESRDKFDDAVQLYTIAIDLAQDSPDLYTIYNNRGIAYKKSKKYENAIADFSKSIELNVGFAFAYNNRGIVYYLIKDYQKALKDFDHAVHLNPQYGYYYFLDIVVASKISKKEYLDSVKMLSSNKNLINDNWLFQLAKYLSGEINIRKLLSYTEDSEDKLCEAYFYIGIKNKAEKKRFTANRYFKKCIKTDQKDFIEYELAKIELKKK